MLAVGLECLGSGHTPCHNPKPGWANLNLSSGLFLEASLAEGQWVHKLVARPGLGGPTKPEGVRGNLTEFEPVFLYSGWIALYSQIEWALNTSYNQDYIFVII